MSDSSLSDSDSKVDLLRRFLNELHQEADPAKVIDDHCARYPDLADQIRGMAEMDAVLQEKTPDWTTPRLRSDGAPSGIATRAERLGPYRIVRVIARGGMGEVFEAVEEPLDRRVAVKTIRSGHSTRPDWMERFLHEREVLARLHHTHIVPIFAAGQEGDLLYFSMPYISGASLGQVIHTARRTESRTPGHMSSTFEDLVAEARTGGERIAPSETTIEAPQAAKASPSALELRPDYIKSTVQLMAAVAEALHHAHEARIIHRDLKPSNLMVEPNGHPWVLDFGLARVRPEPDGPGPDTASPLRDRVSVTVGTVGTPPYMAPEQHEVGREIDPRTDVWGLGVTLYELLTLHQAFKGRESVLDSDPIPPRTLVKNLPRDLEAVILKALKKDPAQRYPTVLALSEDLRHWLRGEPVTARPARLVRRVWMWSKRNKGWAAALAGTFLALLSFGFIAYEREQAKGRELKLMLIERDRLSPHVSFVNQWGEPLANYWTENLRDAIRSVGQPAFAFDRGPLQAQAAAALQGLEARLRKHMKVNALAVAFDIEGRRLLVMGGKLVTDDRRRAEPNQLVLWDSQTDEARTFPAPGPGEPLFLADGTPALLVAAPDDPSALILFDGINQRVVHRFASPFEAEPTVWLLPSASRDGKHLTAVAARRADFMPELLARSTKYICAEDLAGISFDGPTELIVWETETGKRVARISHKGTLALAISPDGRMLAAGNRLGMAEVWSLPEARLLDRQPLDTGRAPITCLAFGRDPVWRTGPGAERMPPWVLAAGNQAGTVILWDLVALKPRASCLGSGVDIKAIDFTPDGQRLATGGRHEVRIWDAATGHRLLQIEAYDYLPGLRFDPDGRRLALAETSVHGVSGTKGCVQVLDLENGRGMTAVHGLRDRIRTIVFSADNRRIAALTHGWQIGVWEWRGGRLLAVLDAPLGDYVDNAGLAFDAEGRRLVCVAKDEARVWDFETKRMQRIQGLPVALTERPIFVGTDHLYLARRERKGRRPPYDFVRQEDDPPVVRLYDLLGPEPTRPIGELSTPGLKFVRFDIAPNGSLLAVESRRRDGEGERQEAQLYRLPDLAPLGGPLASAVVRAGDYDSFYGRFGASGTYYKLNLTLKTDSRVFLEIATRTIRGVDVSATQQKPSPFTTRWWSDPPHEASRSQRDRHVLFIEHDRAEPLLRIPVPNGGCASPDGLYWVLQSHDGGIFVFDPVAIQRHLTELGLGW
jgi:serine/threonine protein kinase/WD40 repeat protein